jgi:hypothetical protein
MELVSIKWYSTYVLGLPGGERFQVQCTPVSEAVSDDVQHFQRHCQSLNAPAGVTRPSMWISTSPSKPLKSVEVHCVLQLQLQSSSRSAHDSGDDLPGSAGAGGSPSPTLTSVDVLVVQKHVPAVRRNTQKPSRVAAGIVEVPPEVKITLTTAEEEAAANNPHVLEHGSRCLAGGVLPFPVDAWHRTVGADWVTLGFAVDIVPATTVVAVADLTPAFCQPTTGPAKPTPQFIEHIGVASITRTVLYRNYGRPAEFAC